MAAMPQTIADAITNTAEVARRISRRIGMPPSVETATHHLFEQWDGTGAPAGLQQADIPIASRIVLPTFIVVPVNRVHGRENAVAAVQGGKGSTFDPAVIEALSDLARSEDFWAGLEGDRIRERSWLEPNRHYRRW
jgi:response regulator RpfG family c-di-GMP phosphodiesterase